MSFPYSSPLRARRKELSRLGSTHNATVACFAVEAQAAPGAMPRVLGLFAKRGLVPDRWISWTDGPRQLVMEIQVQSLPAVQRDIIAASLRQLPDITKVLVSDKSH